MSQQKMYLISSELFDTIVDGVDDVPCGAYGAAWDAIDTVRKDCSYEPDQRDEKIKTLSEHLTAAQKQLTFYERENVRLTKLVGHLTLIHEGDETHEK